MKIYHFNENILNINLKNNMEKKFDICIMNPPYGKNGSGIHNIFLSKALDISKQIVTVQPLT